MGMSEQLFLFALLEPFRQQAVNEHPVAVIQECEESEPLDWRNDEPEENEESPDKRNAGNMLARALALDKRPVGHDNKEHAYGD